MYQDIPELDADASGMVTKLANQIKQRNGTRTNKKKNNRARKQTAR